ncbi:hypothetical protein MKW98_006552, partial [Papaver atlanticum]
QRRIHRLGFDLDLIDREEDEAGVKKNRSCIHEEDGNKFFLLMLQEVTLLL